MSPRPRTPEDVILRSTVELLAERGVANLTVDDVAARAGVGKATIYRHWSSRDGLVRAAIEWLQEPLVEPDTGDLRADLRSLLSQLVDELSGPDSGRVLPSFIDAAGRDPVLASILETATRETRAAYARVIRRGIDRGELPEGTPVDLLTDLLMAPFVYRQLVLGARSRPGSIDACLDLVLAGVRARATDDRR